MFLEEAYKIVRKRDERINSYFKKLPKELEKLFSDILMALNLEVNEENLLALKKRFFHLREDSVLNLLKKGNFSKEEIEDILINLYELTKNFWIKEHEKLIEELAPFVGPFYAEILRGVHNIGVVFSKWQVKWKNHIINSINEELTKEFNGDEAKIMAFLHKNNLIYGDRSYSVLVKKEDGYLVKSYSQFFEEEVKEAVKEIDKLILSLEKLEDEYKLEWILYFHTLKMALLEEKKSELIKKWAEVDKIWMDIKSPIQVGHPLEYYEDKYTKAVALELDVRIENPYLKSNVKEKIISMYKKYCNDKKLLHIALDNISKTKTYISTPALFYAAEFNGLFSAQVVPNDENVSKEKGKKIFAFVDKVYEDIKARPKMALSYEIFTKEFMDRFYKELEDKEKFIKIYDITTIGHEYGHILWVDEESEQKMNRSGMFKNIEEFKATVGGLMAFFENEEKELITSILDDTIKRAVNLIAWMEVDEVLPYYIEGLIHLIGLFESGVINFNSKHLEYNYQNYDKLKEWYKKTYLELSDIYIKKDDAKKFLDKFIYKDKNYYPLNKKVDEFVRYYYNRYKEIGDKIYEG